jgi:hypothetical protein
VDRRPGVLSALQRLLKGTNPVKLQCGACPSYSFYLLN